MSKNAGILFSAKIGLHLTKIYSASLG